MRENSGGGGGGGVEVGVEMKVLRREEGFELNLGACLP